MTQSSNTTAERKTLLIELGTEELPPKALKALSETFNKELLNGLLDAELADQKTIASAQSFATPRRLAISVADVATAQPDQTIERRGPAIQAAFNDAGQATPAALGFAKSCGVDIEQLERLKTDKGEWLSFNVQQKGKSIVELVPELIEQTIKRLPIPKRMRWGDGTAEFVRPVHWLLLMHGSDIIPTTVLDIQSSNTTVGHRFHSHGSLIIEHADQYASILREQGHIIGNFAERQAIIKQQIESLATQHNGHIEEDKALLDEVTGLVEHPNALLGQIDQAFLSIPQECLVSSMRDHQKYFHVVDDAGSLLPYFITVSNINSKDPERVRAGNERVLRARLSDARFFWETDQKKPLESRVKALEKILFHAKLGSVLDKTKRIQALASNIAEQLGANQPIAERGAYLAKADLASNMVGEFDELQGVMGHYYANFDQEPPLVGECIEQHYWPKFAGDQLPTSSEAQAVSLADKLDSLVGIYASGELPTGDKDPYGLRRAALSILRILIEQKQPLTLSVLIASAAQIYQKHQNISVDQAQQQQIIQFIMGRLPAYYQTQKIATTTINAVLACQPDSPLDLHYRVLAVHEFNKDAAATDLSAANKRISNILKKNKIDKETNNIDTNLLIEPAEQQLYEAITNIEQDCINQFNQGDYAAGLKQLATLRSPVDDFFDQVMVMCDDPAQQENRLTLLKKMQSLFLRVADIALLQH